MFPHEVDKKKNKWVGGRTFSLLAIIVTDTAFIISFRKSFFKTSGLRYF